MAKKDSDQIPRPKLNLRQQMFIVEYLRNGGNASQAARDAGYSHTNLGNMCKRLMSNPYIKARIRGKEDRLNMRAEDIRARYEQIARQDIRKAISWDQNGVGIVASSDLDDDTALAISSVKQRIDKDGKISLDIEFHDPKVALAALAKFEGMDKVEPPEPANIALTQNNLNVTLAAMTTEQLKALDAVMKRPELASLKPLLLPLLQAQMVPVEEG